MEQVTRIPAMCFDSSDSAQKTGRTADVKNVAKFGLVRLRQQNNPGHGIVQMVEPIADRLVMRADI